MKRTCEILASVVISMLAAQGGALEVNAQTISDDTYTNPVKAKNLPDPSVIYGGDHYFYVYATDNGEQSIPIYRSKDLVNWRLAGGAFTDNTRPTFVEGGGLWAPEIAKVNGKFVLYYAMSKWGGEWDCGIGVATSDRPQGPFTDLGKLFISSEIGVKNSIDPCHFTDTDGKQYLFWGSFRGIYGIELDESGLKIKEGAEKFQIAPGSDGNVNNIEATMILKKGRYYYLFGSSGTCCDGANSTYHVVVARSTSIKGPFVNKSKRSVMVSHFETILTKSDDVVGPGHNSELIQDDNGDWWMLYHGFQANDIDGGRVLYLDQVKWDSDDWPYIEGSIPSKKSRKPYFKDYVFNGIENLSSKGDFEILQAGHNYLQLSGPKRKRFTWGVYDLSGKYVEGGTGSETKDLWINDLANGVYVVNMGNEALRVQRKVIKAD